MLVEKLSAGGGGLVILPRLRSLDKRSAWNYEPQMGLHVIPTCLETLKRLVQAVRGRKPARLSNRAPRRLPLARHIIVGFRLGLMEIYVAALSQKDS
jgi:hypothetical protein